MIELELLGATGMVGQKIIELIHYHPDYKGKFKVVGAVTSERNWGRKYGDAMTWQMKNPLPGEVGELVCKSFEDVKSEWVLSALPGEQAQIMEKNLVAKGHKVSSNASTYRMDPEVPLLLSGVNDGELTEDKLLSLKGGLLVTNPNCVVAVMGTALAPLLKAHQWEWMNMVSLQAASGAGYPGVASMDLLANTVPYIVGEEDKMEPELHKIFPGAKLPVFVQCHRVPVDHGHTVSLTLKLSGGAEAQAAAKLSDFEGLLEAAPGVCLLSEDLFAPQVRKHLDNLDNKVYVGRTKWDQERGIFQMVCLGHNLVRGAASLALDNLKTLSHLFKKYN